MTTTTLERLIVNRQLLVQSDFNIDGNLKGRGGGELQANKNVYVDGNLVVFGDAETKDLNVGGSVFVGKNVVTDETTTVQKQLYVSEKTTVSGLTTLSSSFETKFDDNLSVAKNVSVGGTLVVSGTTSLSKNPLNEVLLSKTGTISSAQIKSLIANPVSVIPAPGVNKVIVINVFTLIYNHVSVSYTAGGAFLVFGYSVQPAVNVASTTVLGSFLTGASATQLATGTCSNFVLIPSAITSNSAIYLTTTGAVEFATGNGTLQYDIVYNVFTL